VATPLPWTIRGVAGPDCRILALRKTAGWPVPRNQSFGHRPYRSRRKAAAPTP